MFKYLWILPIVLFAICIIVTCIKNVGIKTFIIDVVLSLLIGFGMGYTMGFIASILINSFMSFFFTYDDMATIWRSIADFSLFAGCVGAVVLILIVLIDAYNMSNDDGITRYF